jgi:glucose/arabinose dehydrogenase
MRTWWLRGALAFLAAVIAAAAPQAADTAAAPRVRLVPVVRAGLVQPLFLTHAGDRSGRLFVVEQPGRVRVLTGGGLRATPFLDLRGRVLFGGERGLLGLAFHPRYAGNGRFFVDYTRRTDGATVVEEFRVSADPNVAAPAGRVVLTVPQPFASHKGGMLAFGPGGYLFVGLGDGGGAGDPGNRAQDRRQLLGKILRLDVDRGRPYAIPPGNPFADGGGRPEIFALGFRNPWRFSFDRSTGALYAGDVGEKRVEEVDRVVLGGNYGWRRLEGNLCFKPAVGCDRTGLRPPILTYAHASGRCAVTGGYVYRGRAIPGLVGGYVYGDFCTGEIFVRRAGAAPARLLDTGLMISSFGEDQAGELYVVGLGGTVHRLAAAGP